MSITMLDRRVGTQQEASDVQNAYWLDEWTYIGQGSYREVWLSPSGAVYKVNLGDTYYGSNESEWDNYLRIRDIELPSYLSVPAMSLYGDVIAAEYVDCSNKAPWCKLTKCLCGGMYKGMCQTYLWDELQDITGLTDMHNDNVIPITTQGYTQWVIIDLGQ